VAEKPKAVPRITIDVDAERGKATVALRRATSLAASASLAEFDKAVDGARRLYRVEKDCGGSPEATASAAAALVELVEHRVNHEDADEAAPRARALDVAARIAAEEGQVEESRVLFEQAAERWREAASDAPSVLKKEPYLRATDAFIGATNFERAAGSYALAVQQGEDTYAKSRELQPSRGAHRLKLAVLLVAAGKTAEARAINEALIEDLRKSFAGKVPKEKFAQALDRAQALAEACALAGDKKGERDARAGATDLALGIAKLAASRGEAGSVDEALRAADAAVSEALKTKDDAFFLETYRRAARVIGQGALAGLEDEGKPERRAACVRLLFEAGRRFQLAGDEQAARECHDRAYELSPKYSPLDRRPADELAMALFLLKGANANPTQAEVHLKNAGAFVKALVQGAGVNEDHPSARLRHLALKEAFYRRVGDHKHHREILEIARVAASEGAASSLEMAAAKYNSGNPGGALEFLDGAVGYLERSQAPVELLRSCIEARSLSYYLSAPERGGAPPPETWAEYTRRKAQPFSPEALGLDWRRIERSLLEMDPPAEFATVNDALQFVKGRAPKAAGAVDGP